MCGDLPNLESFLNWADLLERKTKVPRGNLDRAAHLKASLHDASLLFLLILADAVKP